MYIALFLRINIAISVPYNNPVNRYVFFHIMNRGNDAYRV